MIAYMTLIEDPKQLSLFEQIVMTYKDDMYRKAYNTLKDHHWAEDAVSEAFLKIAKNIQKISSLSKQERDRYLVIISRNCAIDLVRQHHLDEFPVDFIEDLEDTVETASVEEAILLEDGFQRLIQAIDHLNPKKRDPMQMYYLYHHTTAEIADLLSIKENTVHARLSRGRKKLAEALKEQEGRNP